ncbi:DNA mismatch repair protein MutS [Sedimentibacter hydroxybenzoicus DSM 7310]|uniref:DNA mismatch repair protein MutS n=1 Tax=Sedimentibacter hydroxybenzoicus DSM 7310 TaxID=1123245 RepID=A0A974GVN1_SEDHY|nr:DNA mismatch repair protein MutS [Sedimentibacter hydroxybenzoicus]NYB73567.1 DNA mismatch repair protein MutS [Sedimentibacter hydroxybenzoicus DSM 7310]
MGKYTPMMEQYLGIKEQYKDCILLYRLGDFYEMFFEDALTASKVLEIALTGRDCGQEERAPMCGVPFHAVDNYISRLIENGYKVAICEQLEDPSAAKGIVKRDVVRVITPGTIIDQNMLDEKSNNYLACIYVDKGFGLSYVDISTGDLYVTENISLSDFSVSNENKYSLLKEEISKINPSEVISNTVTENDFIDSMITTVNVPSYAECKAIILKHFNVISLDSFGMSDNNNAVYSLALLINYLNQTQKTSLEHINKLHFYNMGEYLYLDSSTRKNLELIETVRGKKGQGTLYNVLDYTQTAMGGRLLKKWIEEPLKNLNNINNRLDAVEELYNNVMISNNIKESLKSIYDIERLISRIVYGNCNGRDLNALKQSVYGLPDLKIEISELSSQLFKNIYERLDTLNDIYELIDNSIVEEPPIAIKEGGIIKSGYNSELDEIREITIHGKNWISELQSKEREETGIKNLKIGYTKIFGYYLEVTKSYLNLVPDYYIRKQTLANCERYVTPELKEMEAKILNADELMIKLEYELFLKIRQQIKEQVNRIQETAYNIAVVDVLNSLSIAAVKNNYTRPSMNSKGYIKIIEGRHPVIEKIMKNEIFVPNDTYIDNKEHRMSIITGPNMAGKSTYMRQVALIALLSHIGSFIPAKEAEICVLDKIFTRVGASDDLSQGQSTFMVEMSEVSNILNNATENSLLILDEIGRGTSTYDGLSIAWSVVEYITKKIKAKTLFATHYHELSELESKLKSVKNYRILIKETDDKIIFLRKIAEGSVDRSYGIQVANLAGLPGDVIARAKEILTQLDESDINKPFAKKKKDRITDNFQVSLFNEDRIENSKNKEYKELTDSIKNIDINNVTPVKAFTLLNELIDKARHI